MPRALVLHTCSCGAKYTVEGWEALPLRGYQNDFDDEEPTLEMRNCPCGSTRTVEVTEVMNEEEKQKAIEHLRSLAIQAHEAIVAIRKDNYGTARSLVGDCEGDLVKLDELFVIRRYS